MHIVLAFSIKKERIDKRPTLITLKWKSGEKFVLGGHLRQSHSLCPSPLHYSLYRHCMESHIFCENMSS